MDPINSGELCMMAVGTYTRTLPHVDGIGEGVSLVTHNPQTGQWGTVMWRGTTLGDFQGSCATDERTFLPCGDGPSWVTFVQPSIVDVSSWPTSASIGVNGRPIETTTHMKEGGGRTPIMMTLVACNEGDPDQLPGTMTIQAFSLHYDDRDKGKPNFVAQCLSRRQSVIVGSGPCHAQLSPDGKWLAVASYWGGSLSLHAVETKEGVAIVHDAVLTMQHTEPSNAVLDRQAAPHVHQIVFHPEGDLLVACDLGCDSVFIYALERASSSNPHPRLERVGQCVCPRGSGPRHALFHPKFPFLMFVLCELDSSIVVFQGRRHEKKKTNRIDGDAADCCSPSSSFTTEIVCAESTIPKDFPPNQKLAQ